MTDMPATQQSQAISNSNQILGLASRLMDLYNGCKQSINAWNDDGTLTVVQHLATAPQNADGSLGTADTTPNNADPIDTRVTANTALVRAISANNLASLVTQLGNFVSLVEGNAVSAQAGFRSLFNQAVGG